MCLFHIYVAKQRKESEIVRGLEDSFLFKAHKTKTHELLQTIDFEINLEKQERAKFISNKQKKKVKPRTPTKQQGL